MTVGPAGRTLSVAADLHLEVGGRTATLIGDGGRLTLSSATPEMFLRSLGDLTPGGVSRLRGRHSIGRTAELLSGQGLAVRFEGPHGEIARLGAGIHSWWGRWAVGSDAVALGSWRSVRPLLIAGLVGDRSGPDAPESAAPSVDSGSAVRRRPSAGRKTGRRTLSIAGGAVALAAVAYRLRRGRR